MGAITKDDARLDSDAGHDLEPGVCEVEIEGECPIQIVAAHESEGNAIGEADLLVGELGEEIDRFQLVGTVRPQDRERGGRKQSAGTLSRESIGRSSSDERERLVQDEIAGKAANAISLDVEPAALRAAVVFVPRNVARDKGACIDEDHFSSS